MPHMIRVAADVCAPESADRSAKRISSDFRVLKLAYSTIGPAAEVPPCVEQLDVEGGRKGRWRF